MNSAAAATAGPRALYFCLAAVLLVLAGLGVVLPLLPTTPFVLLASYCLARSSPRLQRRLRRSRLFGSLLRDWERHRGVRLHVKVSAVAAVTLVVGTSLWVGDLSRPLRVALVVLAAIGITVVFWLRTVREDRD